LLLLFPSDIYEDYKHPQLFHNVTGRNMELDIYIPDLSLAFEYQGEQHFKNIYPLVDQQVHIQRDKDKQDACKKVFSPPHQQSLTQILYTARDHFD
jgi:hypothetical protein